MCLQIGEQFLARPIKMQPLLKDMIGKIQNLFEILTDLLTHWGQHWFKYETIIEYKTHIIRPDNQFHIGMNYCIISYKPHSNSITL